MDPSAPPLIVHITPTFAPAGVQVRTVQLMNHFGSVFRHVVLSLNGDTTAGKRIARAVEVRYPPCPHSRNPVVMLRRIWSVLKAEKPALVLTYNWGSIDGILAAL